MSTTPIVPYAYQVECLDALEIGLTNGDRRQSIVMATGLGKTIAAALALKERLQVMPGRVAIFCHQKHILDQWEKALRLVFGDSLSYGRFHSFAPRGQNAQVMLGLFQSMANNLDGFLPDHFRHVVVDESHHGPARTYRPTIEYFAPHAQLLGLTATPNRADQKDIAEIFGPPTFELPLELALAKNYLAKVRYLLLADGIQNLDKIPTNVGTLSRTALNRLFFAPERDERIVELIAAHTAHLGDALRMMVFCRNIAHAERYAGLLPEAWAVHSKLKPRWQDRRIADYLAGDKHTLITVNKFNEGVDYPDTNVVGLLREHGTEMGFLQQIGRALRPVPGKPEVLILDVAGNCERLEVIVALRDKVAALYEELNRSSDPERQTPPPFEATVGSFEFDVQIRKILDVLAVVRGGYTKEILAAQLLTKAVDGVMPPVREVAADLDMPSVPTVRSVFGGISWLDIAKEIGLKPTKQTGHTVASLTALLLAKAVDGVMLSGKEIDADPDLPNLTAIYSIFGMGLPSIARTIGLKASIQTGHTVASLTALLLAKAVDGVMLSGKEIDADPDLPSVQTIRKVFDAGLPDIAKRIGLKTITPESLTALLLAKAVDGVMPTTTEVDADPDMPHSGTIKIIFGTNWAGVATRVGLKQRWKR